MFQGCITASGTGQLAVIGSIRNFSLYQKVSEDNVRPSVQELMLSWKETYKRWHIYQGML